MSNKFSCDKMLYDIVKWLRFLGYDTEYKRYIRRDKSRIYITSNTHLKDVFLLEHGSLPNKLLKIDKAFNIVKKTKLFSKCSICNEDLVIADENDIKYLNKYIKDSFSEFKKCTECGRIYWKGSHYKKMMKFLNDLFPDLIDSR